MATKAPALHVQLPPMETTAVDRLVESAPEIDNDRYYAAPVDVSRLNAGNFHTKQVVEGYRMLAPNLDETHFLPSFDEENRLAQQLGPQWGIPGRIMDMTVQTMPQGNSSSEVVSVVDSNWTSGEVWAKARVKQSKEKGIYDPLEGLTSAIGVFVYDQDAPHPLGRKNRGDWVLQDVMTSWDANPLNGMVTVVRKFKYNENKGAFVTDDKGNMIPDADEGRPYPESVLLSDFAEDFEATFRHEAKTEQGYRQLVDDIMKGFYYTFVKDEEVLKKYPKGYDFNKDPEISELAKEKIGRYLSYVADHNLIDWRVPCRGQTQMNAMDKYLEKYQNWRGKVKGRSVPTGMLQKIQAYRDNIRNEVVQAVSMMEATQALAEFGMVAGSKANQVRWRARMVDPFDLKFARGLKSIHPDSAALKAKIDQKIAEYKGLDPETRLIVQAGAGNALIAGRNIHGRQPQEQPIKSFQYKKGHFAAYAGGPGLYPRQMARSLYDESVPNRMPGIIGRVEVQGPDMPLAQKAMFFDLMGGPALIMRQVLDGYFENRSQYFHMHGKTLSSLVQADREKPEVYVIRSKAHEPGIEVLATVENGQGGTTSIDTEDREGTAFHPSRGTSKLELAAARGRELPRRGGTQRRKLSRELGDMASDEKLEEARSALGGFALLGGTVHAFKPTGSDAQMAVMRWNKDHAMAREKKVA